MPVRFRKQISHSWNRYSFLFSLNCMIIIAATRFILIIDLLHISVSVEMNRFPSDNNNFPYDNNILVLDMVLGSLWGVTQSIDWDNVAKLVPGFSPNEVPGMLLNKECFHLSPSSCPAPPSSVGSAPVGVVMLWC